MRARHAAFLRGGYQDSSVWRDGVPPAGSGTRMRHVSTAVASWATAESIVTGYGAGRDRMTGLLSRSSVWVSRWQRWIRAWGSEEPITNIPTVREGVALSRVGWTSQSFATAA